MNNRCLESCFCKQKNKGDGENHWMKAHRYSVDREGYLLFFRSSKQKCAHVLLYISEYSVNIFTKSDV